MEFGGGNVRRIRSPTILNALCNETQFWDGHVDTLEQQAALPITNPSEPGSISVAEALSRIADDKEYWSLFMQAFGRASGVTP